MGILEITLGFCWKFLKSKSSSEISMGIQSFNGKSMIRKELWFCSQYLKIQERMLCLRGQKFQISKEILGFRQRFWDFNISHWIQANSLMVEILLQVYSGFLFGHSWHLCNSEILAGTSLSGWNSKNQFFQNPYSYENQDIYSYFFFIFPYKLQYEIRLNHHASKIELPFKFH